MKNTLMLSLIIGLIFSLISSCDKNDTIDNIVTTEIHYVNETGVSPIKLDFYRNDIVCLSVSFSSKDTSFFATENNDYRYMTLNSHDSIIVKFGDSLSKTYRLIEYEENLKNPCLRQYYDKEEISETQQKYTFTFTKGMLE